MSLFTDSIQVQEIAAYMHITCVDHTCTKHANACNWLHAEDLILHLKLHAIVQLEIIRYNVKEIDKYKYKTYKLNLNFLLV